MSSDVTCLESFKYEDYFDISSFNVERELLADSKIFAALGLSLRGYLEVLGCKGGGYRLDCSKMTVDGNRSSCSLKKLLKVDLSSLLFIRESLVERG